jgi:sterol desaturase/sphingolipid hydroxylase (fatty acid hydroxylase superfamily)
MSEPGDDQLAPVVTGRARAAELRASPAMFQSRFLDAFTRVHPAVVPGIYVPAIGVLLAFAVHWDLGWVTVGAFAGGWLLWTLTEYWIHRVVFHFEPAEGWGSRFHWIVHGVHHDHPNDPLRLVMPPSVSLPIAALFLGGFYGIFGSPAALAIEAGFLAGYLVYDMIHYYLHHGHPRSRAVRWLRQKHMRHHFQDDTVGFGISAPFWDYVFHTAVPLSRRPTPRGGPHPPAGVTT